MSDSNYGGFNPKEIFFRRLNSFRCRFIRRLVTVLLVMFFVIGCTKAKTEIPDVTDNPVTVPVAVKNLPETVPGYGVVTDGAIEVNLEAKDGSRVLPGNEALVWTDKSNKPLECRVTSVIPNVNLATGQAIAWLKPILKSGLPVGNFASAQIIVRVKTHVATVPKEAVYVKDGQSVVLLEQTSKDGSVLYVSTPIETGVAYGEDIEVVSGLKLGDKVATQAGIGYLYPDFKADADD